MKGVLRGGKGRAFQEIVSDVKLRNGPNKFGRERKEKDQHRPEPRSEGERGEEGEQKGQWWGEGGSYAASKNDFLSEEGGRGGGWET